METVLEHCESDLIFPEHLVEHVIDSKLQDLENLRDKIGSKALSPDAIASEIDQQFLHSATYKCKGYRVDRRPDMSKLGQMTKGK